MTFTTEVAGKVSAIRFYKGPANTGNHIGSLWRADGQRLASAPFTGETADGWQTLTLSTPVSIVPGTSYVVSYHSTVGRYAVTAGQFASGLDRAPLHVPAGGGAYRYGSDGGVFPDSAVNHNYWVDIAFTPDP